MRTAPRTRSARPGPRSKSTSSSTYTADTSPDPPREIQIRWARQLCFELIRRGFNIRLMTFDTFQSTDSMQILEAEGIETDTAVHEHV